MKGPLFAVFALVAAVSWAEGPVLDGVASSGEYTFSEAKGGIAVGASLSADKATLFLSVSAKTKGWVAVGVGSSMMDGALMILGYVDGGKETVLVEQGKGKSHAPTAQAGIASKVTEAGETTTLEVSLPAAPYLKDGQVKLIMAIGATDNTKARHSARGQAIAKF